MRCRCHARDHAGYVDVAHEQRVVAAGEIDAEAVDAARRYLVMALGAADRLDVGHGCGPVHHFADAWASNPARRWLKT
jgi:hypothetical protein